MKLTWIENSSYTGFRKVINGKCHYLGRDRNEAERKAEEIMSRGTGERQHERDKPLTTHQAMDQYKAYLDTMPITQTWKTTAKWRMEFLRQHVPDMQLGKFGYDELIGTVNKLLARPVAKRGRQISPQSVLNLLQVLRQFLGWAEVSGRWMPPVTLRRWESLLKPSGKIAHQSRYNQIKAMPLATWAKLFVHANPTLQAVMLCAVNFGFTQNEASTFTKDMLDLDKLAATRNRHKTGVFCRWPVWQRTAEAIKKVMADEGDNVFLARTGKMLIHYTAKSKTDAVELQWSRLLKKTETDRIGFRYCRKLGGQMVREASDLETARVFLAHTTGSTAEKHYVNPSWERLDVALRVVEQQVEAAIATAEVEKTNLKLFSGVASVPNIAD